jgi:hypothetical protein
MPLMAGVLRRQRALMALDPVAEAGRLSPPLHEEANDIGWQGHRFAGGEDGVELVGQRRRWQLAEGGQVPNTVELQSVDRHIGLGCGVEGSLSLVVGATAVGFIGKARGPQIGRAFGFGYWRIFGWLRWATTFRG